MESATEQGAQPWPRGVSPVPPHRSSVTGFIHAPLWSTQDSG